MQDKIETLLRTAQSLHMAGKFAESAAAFQALIAIAPDAINPQLRLSEAWEGLGRFRNARDAAMAAARNLRAAGKWEALPFVTLRLLAFDERDQVRDTILAADWNHPAVLRQSPALSQHLWLCDAYDDALRLIELVSKQVPASPLLSYSRANALRYSGRIEEATAELETCIALAPNHPHAHWTLAYQQTSSPVGVRVDRIRAAKAALAATDPGQVYLDYALFKELDDAGDTDAAWAALARGMKGKRASIRFDAPAQAQAIAGIAQRKFRPTATDQGTETDHVPLFIVGLPRSGTTLLDRMLSNHADVASAGELGDFTQSLSWELDTFVGSPPALATQALLENADHAAIGRRYLDRTRSSAGGKRFLIDKNPSNIYHAIDIARALPSARILCLLREPMDACFSNLKELFSADGYGYSYDFAEMAAQYRGFAAVVASAAEQMPERFMVVRYEELVSDPTGVLARITPFCGLPAQAGLEDIAANRAPVLTASVNQVRESVHARNVGSWRRYQAPLEPLRALLEG